LPHVVRGLADTGYEVVCTAMARDVTALGEVPASVRVLEQFPLSLLLPSCAAVVHHGGGGSVMTSLWAGVPQLAVTFAAEQTVSAVRVAGAGAGIHLPGHLADRTTVRGAALELVTGAAYQEAAAALRSELLARPTPAELVERLEKLASG